MNPFLEPTPTELKKSISPALAYLRTNLPEEKRVQLADVFPKEIFSDTVSLDTLTSELFKKPKNKELLLELCIFQFRHKPQTDEQVYNVYLSIRGYELAKEQSFVMLTNLFTEIVQNQPKSFLLSSTIAKLYLHHAVYQKQINQYDFAKEAVNSCKDFCHDARSRLKYHHVLFNEFEAAADNLLDIYDAEERFKKIRL